MADILKVAQGLTAQMEALAALGANLRVRLEGLTPDPRVADLLDRVCAAVDVEAIAAATPQQQTVALGFIRAFFAQAMDLLADPARPPGWVYEDPVILQQQGLASRLVAHTIAAVAVDDLRLAKLLDGERRFLDIGTGVGWLAVEAATIWPKMRVVGLDVFEPALVLARRNVAGSAVADRVELRLQSAADLDEDEAYDVAWFPGPFIPRDLVEPVLARIRAALRPGGAIVFGFFGAPTPLGEALTALRVVRAGGHPWSGPEVVEQLERAGYDDVRIHAPQSLATLVIGYR